MSMRRCILGSVTRRKCSRRRSGRRGGLASAVSRAAAGSSHFLGSSPHASAILFSTMVRSSGCGQSGCVAKDVSKPTNSPRKQRVFFWSATTGGVVEGHSRRSLLFALRATLRAVACALFCAVVRPATRRSRGELDLVRCLTMGEGGGGCQAFSEASRGAPRGAPRGASVKGVKCTF